MSTVLRVNLGGEGEEPGVINQQGPWALDPAWRSSREGKTLAELQAEGHQFVIADNTQLPFADDSVDEVITNSVPIDRTTQLGPGVQSTEVQRILKPGGSWAHDGVTRYTKP
jgi:ubiquinone/menaquinone biosynthesis C-methylase UbiE